MITYNDIFEALRKEKYSEKLQTLSKKFVQEVSSYISEKRRIVSSENDMFSDEIVKTKKQLENSKSIFDEMMLLRKKKLLGLVFVASETGINKSDFESMLDFEKEFFDKTMENVKEAEKKLSAQFVNGSGGVRNENNDLKLVLFLQDVEEFVDLKGDGLGPFSKGDIVNLSGDVANILISDKKVEMVSEDWFYILNISYFCMDIIKFVTGIVFLITGLILVIVSIFIFPLIIYGLPMFIIGILLLINAGNENKIEQIKTKTIKTKKTKK